MRGEHPSPRETEIWKMIALGWSRNEISQKLGTSEKTIDQQTTSLYKKMGFRSRADAARLAMVKGMIGSVEPSPPAHKRSGYDGKTHEHDMAIILAELELQKAKTRAAEARADRLESEKIDLLRRIPKGS